MRCLKLVFEALQLMAVKTTVLQGDVFADTYFVKKKAGNKLVPYVPASSVKGAVKKAIAYALKEQGKPFPEELFDIEKGGLVFEDCTCVGYCNTVTKPGITINKALGTVMEERLFYQEKVVPGSRFECEVCGEERNVETLKKLLMDDLVKKYFYYVGLGDGMVKLVEVKEK